MQRTDAKKFSLTSGDRLAPQHAKVYASFRLTSLAAHSTLTTSRLHIEDSTSKTEHTVESPSLFIVQPIEQIEAALKF